MGQSTDGILFFGILFEEDAECPWATEDAKFQDSWYDWEEVYVKKMGLRDQPLFAESGKQHDEWAKWLDEKHALVGKAKCTVGSHCCADEPMWYVAVSALLFTASRGNAHTFDAGLPVASSNAMEDFRDFCKLMGIEWRAPQWHLVSDWS